MCLGGRWVSGIVARNNYSTGIIKNCINHATIISTPSMINGCAGIASHNYGTILNCINTGLITGISAAGIVAFSTEGIILNCINMGTIEGTEGITRAYTGGIIGSVSNGVISHTTASNCINYGFIKGNINVGGIVGQIQTGSNVTVYNCSNFGVVRGNNNVGCIVGRRDAGTVTNCHYDKQMCGE